MGGGIDWEKVNASLPYQRGEEQQEERRKLCTLIPSHDCSLKEQLFKAMILVTHVLSQWLPSYSHIPD